MINLLAHPQNVSGQPDVDTFQERGVIGPLPVLDQIDCRRLCAYIDKGHSPAGVGKQLWTCSRLVYETATRRDLVELVSRLLGEDVMLWGASFLRRRPGQVHPWHSDMETCRDQGRTVSVWIGLKNTNRRSSLHFVTHSHQFGVSLQQAAWTAGRHRHKRHGGRKSSHHQWSHHNYGRPHH